MKFCDKLQKIRKENNITQEGLADKLNVSRQAVSKWESGTAYPDTEKLIQISKIFNVSLDELVNDNKESVNKVNEKFNFMETFNMIFDFIQKTFSMFWSMKFSEKIKFLFEMGILILAIVAASAISTEIICELVRRIFIFIPNDILKGIIYLVDTLLYIVWIVLGAIIFVKVLKTRYLDYYVIITDDKISERKIEEPIKELKEKKEYKVVIRDPKHSSFNLLKKLGSLFIFGLKILGVFIAIPVIISFIFLVIALIVSLAYLFNGLFFNGISIALFGSIVFTFLIIWFIYNLIFNQKNAYQKMFIVFIAGISLIGIGVGLSFTALSSFEIVDDTKNTKNEQSHTIDMSDNLVIDSIINISDDKLIIDNSLSNIKIDTTTYGNVKTNTYTYMIYEDGIRYKVINIYAGYDGLDSFKAMLDDLKDKKINKYNLYDIHDDGYEIDKVYISSSNLTKIKENYKKIYED